MDFATLAIRVDASGAIREVEKFERSVGRMGTDAERSISALQTAFTRLSGVASAGLLGREFVQQTTNAQYALAQMQAVVLATGGAAGKSVADLERMSVAMQKVSIYADDVVQGGLTRLLSFTSITGPTFDRAAQAVLNFASAYRVDLVNAAEIVGKALEYPKNATEALARQGFRFSEELKGQIAVLVELGRTAEAQALVLGQLEAGIDGVAAAARDTLGGALAGLRNAVGDLFERPVESTRGLITAINAVEANLGKVVEAAVFLGVVLGARAFAGAARRITEYAAASLQARAATIAVAQAESARTAQLVAQARVERTVALERLQLAIQDKVSMAERTAAANVLVAANNRLIASTTAHTAAMAAQVQATSVLSAAMTRLAGVASTAWAAIGGPIGAVVISAYAAVRAVTAFADASRDKVAREAEEAAQRVNALSESFTKLTGAQLLDRANDIAENISRIGAAAAEAQAKLDGMKGAPLRLGADDLESAMAARTAEILKQAKTVDEINAKLREERALYAAIVALIQDVGTETAKVATLTGAQIADNAQRVRLAQQALEIARLESVEARLLAVEHRHINETLKAESELTGAALEARKAALATERALGIQVVQVVAAREREAELLKRAQSVQEALARFTADQTRREEERAKSGSELLAQLGENVRLQRQAEEVSKLQGEMAERLRVSQQAENMLRNIKLAMMRGEISLTDEQLVAVQQLLAEWEAVGQRIITNNEAVASGTKVVEDAAGAMAEGFAQALSAASGMLSVLGESGRAMSQLATNAAQVATNLARIQSIKDAEGARVGFGAALGGAAGAAGTATAVSGALGIVGGVIAIADALDLFGSRVKEQRERLRQAADDFNRALESFALRQAVDPITAQLQGAREIARTRIIAEGGAITDESAFRAMFADLNAMAAAAAQFGGAMQELYQVTARNIAIITAETTAKEAAAAAARVIEAERAQGELDIELARAQGNHALADALEFQRRYNDAVAAGRDELHLATLEQINAANEERRAAEAARRLAEEERRLADERAAQIAEIERLAEANRRFTESLVGRGLSALGMDRAAEDAMMSARQRQEMTDAIRDGMTDTNLALLAFVQFAERERVLMLRAIEDGTRAIQQAAAAQIKAIDDQILAEKASLEAFLRSSNAEIDAIKAASDAEQKRLSDLLDTQRESLGVAKEQLQAAARAVQATERVVDSLRQFGGGLNQGEFSPLSPLRKLDDARAQFERLAAAALGGDKEAGMGLTGAAQAFLAASRGVNASNAGYVEDFRRVQEIVAAAQGVFGGQLSAEQQALAAAEATVSGIEKQIAETQRLREQAKESAQDQIAVLKLLQEAARDASLAEIERLQGVRDAIEAQAAADIAELVALVETAFQARIEAHEFYDTFAETAQLDRALHENHYERAEELGAQQVEAMRTGFTAMQASLQQLRSELAELKAGQREETVATNKVHRAVQELSR